MEEPHVSVLPREVAALLPVCPGAMMVDATVGAAGHTEILLARVSPNGLVIGFDVDPHALEIAQTKLALPAQTLKVAPKLIRANFSTIKDVLPPPGEAPPLMGILADLGVSSMQLDDPSRGFSFREDAELDLRMDPDLPRTGADLLRDLSEKEIADLLFFLGGERGSRRIARRIVAQREENHPITTTGQLERLVRTALRVRGHKRIHPATRTFQALRLAVNRELEVLESFLQDAPEQLAPNGVLLVISFHSGEDRLVKQRFKALVRTGRFQLTHRSVVCAAEDERARNPRSRSAKLRGIKRIS